LWRTALSAAWTVGRKENMSNGGTLGENKRIQAQEPLTMDVNISKLAAKGKKKRGIKKNFYIQYMSDFDVKL
jgi:hypothetical protein